MSVKRKICITTDCVCDLPDEMLRDNDIDIVYFYIETDTGRFRDRSEITAQNIFEYLKNGGQICAERILDCYNKMYKGQLTFGYDVVKMESSGLMKKHRAKESCSV